MELKILHFYPDLMSLYGSYANVSILKRTLEEMGNTVTVERVELGGDADLTHADFVYMGAGTERAQKAALLYFSKLGDAVKAAADAGVTMLFAGNSMELLGKTITDDAGKVYEGLGLADFTAVQNKKRFVEDVYGHTDLYEDAVVGFVNRCSVITGVETPLLASMDMGGWVREMGCGRLMMSSYRWVGVRNSVSAPISMFLFWLHSCSITLYDLQSACFVLWPWRPLPGSCLLALHSFQISS